jgi:hypothetical protein
MKKLSLAVLLISLFVISSHTLTAAQSLAGFRIGDRASALDKLGTPAATEKYKSYVVRKWKLSNGNELSATVDSSAKIVYLECDWSGEASGRSEVTESDLPDLKFGKTKLSDLRARFGSNGFAYSKRGGVITIPDGVVMLNSYEVGSNVVTFYTVAGAFADAGKGAGIAERAELDAISIADAQYAKSEWGECVYDPKYKKIEWK